MMRRTFIQGAAASLTAWPFAAVHGQNRPAPSSDQPATIIYNENADSLTDLAVNPLDPKLTRAFLHEVSLPFPDPQSLIYSVWMTIFKQPLLYELPPRRHPLVGFDEEDYRLNQRFGLAQAPIISTRWQTSQNWSGAFVEPRNGNMFTEVAGGWAIPCLPQCPQNLAYPADPSCPTTPISIPRITPSSSIWIGLDGQRRYANSSMPQVGTTQGFRTENGQLEYRAWHQWWMSEQPGYPDPIPIEVNSGDNVFCAIQVVNLTQVIVVFTKFGTPNICWTRILEPRPPKGGTTPQISGATAQWIVERPADPSNTSELLSLVNYGKVQFTSCVATAAIGPDASAAEYQSLDSARFIRMYNRLSDGAPRIVRLSEPSRTTPDQQNAFNVAYVGP